MARLPGFQNLTSLNLSGTQVTGLGELAHLRSLAHLDVRGTAVTAQELAKLQAALPACRIVSH
jgi:hypothetical protein